MCLKQKPSHCLNHHTSLYPFLLFTRPALLTFSMWEIPCRVVSDARSRDWGKNVGKKAFRTLESQMFWVLEQRSRTMGALWTKISVEHTEPCVPDKGPIQENGRLKPFPACHFQLNLQSPPLSLDAQPSQFARI